MKNVFFAFIVGMLIFVPIACNPEPIDSEDTIESTVGEETTGDEEEEVD